MKWVKPTVITWEEFRVRKEGVLLRTRRQKLTWWQKLRASAELRAQQLVWAAYIYRRLRGGL